jgi:hypothetical protein
MLIALQYERSFIMDCPALLPSDPTTRITAPMEPQSRKSCAGAVNVSSKVALAEMTTTSVWFVPRHQLCNVAAIDRPARRASAMAQSTEPPVSISVHGM